MSDDDDERMDLFLRLLDTLAEMNEKRPGDEQSPGDDGGIEYDIRLQPTELPRLSAWLVTTRRRDDGLLVVADVPRVEPGAVDVDVDSDAGILQYRVDDETVERVALPDPDVAVAGRASRNSILELRLE